MKKSQKILSICLPIVFGITTLASTAAVLASCSNDKIEEANPNPTPIKNIYITNNDINQLSQEFDNQINTNTKITLDEFNNAFTGSQAQTNISKIADVLKISEPNVIERVFADNSDGINKITIQVANDYKFAISDDNTQTSKVITGSINENGSSLIFSGVEFANGVNVTTVKINDLAVQLDQMQSQYVTFNEFSQAFSNDATANIQKVCNVLGINDPNFISNVTVSGTSNNATISIQAGINCKFIVNDTNNLLQTKSSGIISDDKTSITYSNVQFYELANISSFVSDINLNDKFITQTSNNEISNPSTSTTSTDVNLSYSDLNLNITSSSNSYFNVALPNSVNNVFNVPSTISNASIEWKIKEGQSNGFSIGNSNNGNQFIYNTTQITNSATQSIILTASFLIDNKKVANDVNIIFNFKVQSQLDTSNIVLNPVDLNKAFTFSGYVNNYPTIIKTSPNTINIDCSTNKLFDVNKNFKEPRIAFFGNLDFTNLNQALKNVLRPYVSNITQINWNAPSNITCVSTRNPGETIFSPDLSAWTNIDNLNTQVSLTAFTKTTFDWQTTIITDNSTNNTFNITFSVSITMNP